MDANKNSQNFLKLLREKDRFCIKPTVGKYKRLFNGRRAKNLIMQRKNKQAGD